MQASGLHRRFFWIRKLSTCAFKSADEIDVYQPIIQVHAEPESLIRTDEYSIYHRLEA